MILCCNGMRLAPDACAKRELDFKRADSSLFQAAKTVEAGWGLFRGSLRLGLVHRT